MHRDSCTGGECLPDQSEGDNPVHGGISESLHRLRNYVYFSCSLDALPSDQNFKWETLPAP